MRLSDFVPHGSLRRLFIASERTKEDLQKFAAEYAASAEMAKLYQEVESAIAEKGEWQAKDEWRIFTVTSSRIEKKIEDLVTWYHVSVECDGQRFACKCPHLGRAHFFAKWYEHLVVNQYYAVGPPWATVKASPPP